MNQRRKLTQTNLGLRLKRNPEPALILQIPERNEEKEEAEDEVEEERQPETKPKIAAFVKPPDIWPTSVRDWHRLVRLACRRQWHL